MNEILKAATPQMDLKIPGEELLRTFAKELSGVHVLCIDDQQDILAIVTTILARQGAIVTQCLSGESALALLKDRSFDVIISDLSMPPGIDGYDFAHALRKNEENEASSTPTICLSGQALDASPKKHFADFQIYLAKPLDSKRLVDIVRRLAEADGAAVEAGTLANYEADKRAHGVVASIN